MKMNETKCASNKNNIYVQSIYLFLVHTKFA